MLIVYGKTIAFQATFSGPNGESMADVSLLGLNTPAGSFFPIEKSGFDERTFTEGHALDVGLYHDGWRGVHVSGAGIVTLYGFFNKQRIHRRLVIKDGSLEVFDPRQESAVAMHYAIRKAGDLKKGIAAYSKAFLVRDCWRYVDVPGLAEVLKEFGSTNLLGETSQS